MYREIGPEVNHSVRSPGLDALPPYSPLVMRLSVECWQNKTYYRRSSTPPPSYAR